MHSTETAPRVYVACLAAYNSGRLHGAWIDADQDADAIMDEVQKMLAASPEPNAEEWAIHDFEGFEGIELSESQDFETVATFAAGIAEHGAAYAAWVANDSTNREVSDFEEAYQGEWSSLEAYAEDYLESTGQLAEVPEALQNYIDFESFARDMEYGGDVWTADDGCGDVYVFTNY